MSELTKLTKAIREEIVRQYRDDDRGKCNLGVPFWEENIQPALLAQIALEIIHQQQPPVKE